MASKVTNAGERLILGRACENLPDLFVCLARAEFSPDDDQVFADFTEANFAGYVRHAYTYVGLEGDNPGGRAIADFVTAVFTCTGNSPPNLIYGYWIMDAGNTIYVVERFIGSPRPMDANGKTISLPLQLRLWSPV